jgi:RNA ligase (TIGR02306 family)
MSEIKRKLATIQTIDTVKAIPGADRIKVITFKSNGWKCVTNIETNPQPGDRRIYFEVDSVLPSDEKVFAFMEPYHYRVKTIRLKNQVSQGLALPLDDIFQSPEISKKFNEAAFRGDFGDPRSFTTVPARTDSEFQGSSWYLNPKNLPDGTDLTDALGVIKYELPETSIIGGDTKGSFPGFIEKTDEERAQNFSNIEEILSAHEWDVSVKMDGTSGTFFLMNGEFGVCSRNQELKDSEGNVFWKMARKYNIENRMKVFSAGMSNLNFAIQGEVAGPGIQSNRAKLTEVQLFVFTIQNIDRGIRVDNGGIQGILDQMNRLGENFDDLKMVPTLTEVPPLKTLEDVAKLAEGNNLINESTREGIVLRAKNNAHISMKFINPSYLIQHSL